MPDGFVMMQIGDPLLDRVYDEAIVPALKDAGFDAKRVDKHNEGGLLKSEIVRFIQDSDILIADLTNERPNVYLEVGYAMGLDRVRNLILTVRDDHFPDNPKWNQGDPKVHFDLAGYDILQWDFEDLKAFQIRLTKKIKNRTAILKPQEEATLTIWDEIWIEEQRGFSASGLADVGKPGLMEVRAALHHPKGEWTQGKLLEAAQFAPINTFGWPIGVFLTNQEEGRPKPRTFGVSASIRGKVWADSYDYWAIRKNGDFFLSKTIFEDERTEGELFFNTRIVRVAETFAYLLRLYGRLQVDPTSFLSVAVRHKGLAGRRLTSSSPNRSLSLQRVCQEDESEAVVTGSLDEIEGDLSGFTRQILEPLFVLFDFFELSQEVFEDIVQRYMAGEVV